VPQHDDRSTDWYSISLDTLRAWGWLLLILVLLVVGFFGFRLWSDLDLGRRAEAVILEAGRLQARLDDLDATDEDIYRSGVESLAAARTAQAAERHREALDQGLLSRTQFQSLLGEDGMVAAELVSIRGRVQLRRGGQLRDARVRTELYAGDVVRAVGNTTAELQLVDGTRISMRPGATLVVGDTNRSSGSNARTAKLESGVVNLNTSREGSTIETPEAEARIDGGSEAVVGYDAESRRGVFGTYTGGMEVASSEGEARRLDAMQQVVQSDGGLSQPAPLPAAPRMLEPAESTEIDPRVVRRLTLRWEPVAAARGYALQVARNQLFSDTVIEDLDRAKTSATLGIEGDGSFLWRVASLGSEGVVGPWSEPRSFRVFADERTETRDDISPEIQLEEPEIYGNLVIFTGRTEPGADLTIQGEAVQVRSDGAFSKTLQLDRAGRNEVRIRARDAAGNVTEVTRSVVVEIV
jgi:hypothetical protein